MNTASEGLRTAQYQSAVRAAQVRACCALTALALGLVIARHFSQLPSTLLFAIGAGLCALAALASGRACKAALLLAILALGAGVYQARLNEHHKLSLAHLLGPDTPTIPTTPTILTVEGVILDAPRVVEAPPSLFAREPTLRFRLRVTDLIDPDPTSPAFPAIPARGVLNVHGPAQMRDNLHAGQRIEITGNARALRAPLNPGQTDPRPFQRQGGVVGSISAPNPDLIKPAHHASWLEAARAQVISARATLRTRAEHLLLDPVSDDQTDPRRAVLAALVLGQRDTNSEDQRAAFTRVGLAHMMAISGFHVAMMALAAMLLVRCAGDLGRLEPAIVALLIVLYLVIVPASPPVLRAATMVLVVLASEAMGRRYDHRALLLWTAFVMLLLRPADLWSMGFQLSFLLVGALMTLASPVHDAILGMRIKTDLPQRRRWWSGPVEAVKLLLVTSLICWLLAMPIVIYHTGLVSPLAIVATVVTLPLIMATLILAYAALIVGVIIPPAAALAGWVLSALAGWTLWLVEHIDAVPIASLTLPRVSLLWTLAAVVLVVVWLTHGRLRDGPLWAATCIILLWLVVQVWARGRLPADQALRIDALAVGDGTCLLVRSGSDALLWDCGSDSPTAGARLIPRTVRALGAHRVRTAIVTHPNADHYNALYDSARHLGVRELLLGQRTSDAARLMRGAGLRELFQVLDEQGFTVRVVSVGDTLELGDSTLTFLSPPTDAPFRADNDHSLVARIDTPVTGGSVTTLLTGDIQREAINSLLETEPALSPQIIEMPHHGSVTDAAAELIARLDPDIIVQSTGPSRSHDPRWNFAKERRRWLTTSTDGCATVIVNRDGSIRTFSTRGD